MRLSKLSLLYSGILILVVCINALVSFFVLGAFNHAQQVQDMRLQDLRAVENLRREADILSRLVRTYVATREGRYLEYYYAIIAIRKGEKPIPPAEDPVGYWDQVIAGEVVHNEHLEGPRISLRARMASLAFGDLERGALEEVLDRAEALRYMEQTAFAASQGYYDPDVQMLAQDGQPHPEMAVQLIYGADYQALQASLSRHLSELRLLVDRRTSAEVADARSRLHVWIIISMLDMILSAALVIFGMRTLRQQVLTPLASMCALTDELARGRYDVRMSGTEGVPEVQALQQTFNSMAASIEHDIREREAFEAELREARARAEQAAQTKSMFLANMSHEIRTPLNAVLGMSDLLLHSRLPPRQRDYAEKIRSAGRALLDTLNAILDFSKIEAGRLQLESIPFSLERLLSNACLLVEQAALDKGIELLFEARSNSPALMREQLLGDPLRLGQVLGNLLSNAVKFTTTGHVCLRVDGKPAEDGRLQLSISIEDTGIGMRPDQVERIFEEFVQADSTTTRQFGGTGLGLAISRKLVEAMGGEIRVRSEPKRGSTFQVLLTLPREGEPAPAPQPFPDELRVLVVDDYPEARLAVLDLFSLLGVDWVDAASSGQELAECLALAEQEASPYDLLLLDGSLYLREEAQLQQLFADHAGRLPRHVALMSLARAMDESGPVLPVENLHFCDKPLFPGTLLRLVDEVLGRSSSAAHALVGVQGSLEGMRVLVVEDNPTNRDVATALLGRWGVDADVAVDGQDAVTLLNSRDPCCYAVVLMDLQMPGMDGYEATRKLRSQPEFAQIPIYALSAHSRHLVLERCLNLGMNGCLAKPYELAELYAVLRRHYGGNAGAPSPVLAPVAGEGSEVLPDLPGLSEIPGLDPHCAIHDTGVSPTLYPRLLARFRNEFAQGPKALVDGVRDQDWQQVSAVAHTLKGRAGLLGMASVAAAASRLETAARARDAARARGALEALVQAIGPIVEGLQRVLPSELEAGVTG
ncbi:ATP-binding protein [Zoogloea sp.]|uniref:ATP-binding protein n=2 Tax=Zoogloea sp. TaxID=49181 RepID=UPI0035B2F5FE